MTPLRAFAPSCFRILAAGALLLGMAAAPPTANAAGRVEARVDLAFAGTSSLHGWEGKAPASSVTLQPSTVAGAWDGAFAIPVAGLDTGNSSRDARMREMFRSDRWPDLRVALRAIDPASVERDRALTATLTIGEVTRDVPVRVANWKRSGTTASFDAEANVSLADFALDAPTVLGLIRVADRVIVQGHVELTVNADAPSSRETPQ